MISILLGSNVVYKASVTERPPNQGKISKVPAPEAYSELCCKTWHLVSASVTLSQSRANLALRSDAEGSLLRHFNLGVKS
jgi:hypothetical protein